MKSEKDATRSVETEIRIEAHAEKVWKALTDPVELTRWFPIEAGGTPGPGGELHIRWDDDFDGVCRIHAWDPPRHLRTTWFEALGPKGTSSTLVVDYRLESHGGTTTLRLVHSGFGGDRAWDDEYNGVRRGWQFELRSLRHYLERHSGKSRQVAWVRHPVVEPPADVWDRIWNSRELLAQGTLPDSQGEQYGFTTATGERLEGTTMILDAPLDFAGTVGNMNDGLFRFGYERFGGKSEIHLWLSLWDRPAGEAAAIEQRWKALAARLPDRRLTERSRDRKLRHT